MRASCLSGGPLTGESMDSNREYSFREAVPSDVPLIMEFMRLLAAHSKKEQYMRATEEKVRKWVFEDRSVEVIFVLDGRDREAGFALYFFTCWPIEGKSGIYLENLLVREEYRGQGYGRALLDYIARTCAARGMECMEWDCLAWDEEALGFYAGWGAKQDHTFITLYVEDVPKLLESRGG